MKLNYTSSVQNPRHKCDLGNKNDSVSLTSRQYLSVIIIITIIILRLYYIFVCALQLTLQAYYIVQRSVKIRT